MVLPSFAGTRWISSVCLAGCLLIAPLAKADFISGWTLTNGTGDTVTDFEGIFSGTGGSIHDAAIYTNAEGTSATITGSGNMVRIEWDPDFFFPDGATMQFTFFTTTMPNTLE